VCSLARALFIANFRRVTCYGGQFFGVDLVRDAIFVAAWILFIQFCDFNFQTTK
jgi:hypothetical protein